MPPLNASTAIPELEGVAAPSVVVHWIAPLLSSFVRNRRLDAVYRTLLGSEPGEVTVTRTATDSGFYHLSRFAADYFEAFGEHPSETLHR